MFDNSLIPSRPDISSAQQTHELGHNKQSIAVPIILQYWQVLLRWKWVIAGIIASTMALGLLATLLTTPQYLAKARIEISRDQKNVTNVVGLESRNAGNDLEFYQTQYALLTARSLAERVSRQLRLAGNPTFLKAHGVNNSSAAFVDLKGKPSEAERQKLEKQAVALLIDNISISPIRGSALIDVSYSSASPILSAQIANEWTNQFIDSSMDRRFASTADARKFLEGRLADLRARLEQSERDAVGFASEKGIVSLNRTIGEDGRTESERTLVATDLETLNSALAQATADRIAAESKVSAAAKDGANSEALTNNAITQLRQKRAEANAEYAKLMIQFEPGYPSARALLEQIRTLDAGLAREEARVTSSRSAELREATERERRLEQQVNRLKSQFDTQQRNGIQYTIYQREADTNRQLYDSQLQRYKEIGVAGVGTNNIAIVDAARVPDQPSSPNFRLNMALAFLAGIGLAALATLALDQIDEGLRDPVQVERLLQVPLLGSVPESNDTSILESLADAKSMISEAYLSVRSNLAFSTDHGVPRTFMVTSTRPAEGKSTTSIALATMLGRTGKSVLLIDADMRSPSIHSFVGAPNTAGLSNFLAGDSDWNNLIKNTNTKGLQLLPAGPMPPSAAELLSSDRMLMLVRMLSEHFDHIVIDSPPILGLADAPLLSRAVEGCIFVVEAEGVAVRGLKASLNRLLSVHGHVFGIVLTKLKQSQAGYGYSYGYGYGANE